MEPILHFTKSFRCYHSIRKSIIANLSQCASVVNEMFYAVETKRRKASLSFCVPHSIRLHYAKAATAAQPCDMQIFKYI